MPGQEKTASLTNRTGTFTADVEGENVKLDVWLVDEEGRQSEHENSKTYNEDRQAPTISSFKEATGKTEWAIPVQVTASDDTSKIASYTYTGGASPVADGTSHTYSGFTTNSSHKLTVEVKDKAGNSASKELTATTSNHNFGNYTVKTAATCEANGTEERKCNNAGCGKTETRAITKLGHQTGTIKRTKEPTCTAKGVDTTYCSRCGTAIKTTEVAALGHKGSGNWVVTKAATCAQEGQNQEKCVRFSVCGTYTQTSTIPKTEHSYTQQECGYSPTSWIDARPLDSNAYNGYSKGCDVCGNQDKYKIRKLYWTCSRCHSSGGTLYLCDDCTWYQVNDWSYFDTVLKKQHCWNTVYKCEFCGAYRD